MLRKAELRGQCGAFVRFCCLEGPGLPRPPQHRAQGQQQPGAQAGARSWYHQLEGCNPEQCSLTFLAVTGSLCQLHPAGRVRGAVPLGYVSNAGASRVLICQGKPSPGAAGPVPRRARGHFSQPAAGGCCGGGNIPGRGQMLAARNLPRCSGVRGEALSRCCSDLSRQKQMKMKWRKTCGYFLDRKSRL